MNTNQESQTSARSTTGSAGFVPTAYYLPSPRSFATKAELEFGANKEVRLPFPVVGPADVEAVLQELREGHRRYLSKMTVEEIIQVLDEVIRRWGDRNYWLRQQAERLLPTITSYSPQMVAAGLQWLNGFNGDALRKQLREEVGDPRYLDGFQTRPHNTGMTRAYGPEVSTHVFSGNVPGVPTLSFMSGFLTKSAILGKAATEEPLFPVLFAHSLAEVSPEMGRCIAVLYWKGGTEDVESVALGKTDAVFAYGGDEAVQSIRRRLGIDVPFLGYGHKIGFQIVSKEMLGSGTVRDLAARAATDVSFYDQQGCVCPHVIYLERGGEVSPKDFASILSEEMAAFNERLPRGPLAPAETVAINTIRETYEFKSFADDDVVLHASAGGTDWTVILDTDPTFEASCNNRVVRIKPVDSLEQVLELVSPHKRFLQTVGVALTKEQLETVAARLGRLGASRVCAIGSMGNPPYSWHHDGHFNFAEVLRWIDIEADALAAAERG
jgi:hypothetical protein